MKEEIDKIQDKYVEQALSHYIDAIKVYSAMNLAAQIHKDQLYGNEPVQFPYLYHLDATTKVLYAVLPTSYPNKTDLLIAGWLHDSLEDHSDKITYDDIKEKFGQLVADIVKSVTKEKYNCGEIVSKKERLERLYQKLLNNDNAIIVKLADRIANVEFCITMASIKQPNLYDMYSEEYDNFREALYNKNSAEPVQKLWNHLDNLIKNPNFFLT